MVQNKIIVIGPGGAGKSYFSKELAKNTKLPLYHLDNIFWKEDKTHISREEFDEKLLEILEKDNWIIDGDRLWWLTFICGLVILAVMGVCLSIKEKKEYNR